MIKDFLLDWETKDLDSSGGDIKLTNEREGYYQTLLLGLSLNIGEFFTHINHGLPWLKNPNISIGDNVRYFLGNDFPNPEIFIKTELDRHILKQPFVESIDSNHKFDRNTRTFTYTVRVNTIGGESIEFKPYLIDL